MSILILLILWLCLLFLFHYLELYFYKFFIGSIGMFFFIMTLFRNNIEKLLEYSLTFFIQIISKIFAFFKAYPSYSLVSIYERGNTLTFFIDYECSGFVEMTVFTSLLIFFPVHDLYKKLKLFFVGFIYIFLANVIRVMVIIFMVKLFGKNIFFISHTVIARFLFFLLTIVIYYRVFTVPHIENQKVGKIK